MKREIKMWFKWFWHCFIRDEMFKDGRGTHDYCKYCTAYTKDNKCNGVRYL